MKKLSYSDIRPCMCGNVPFAGPVAGDIKTRTMIRCSCGNTAIEDTISEAVTFWNDHFA